MSISKSITASLLIFITAMSLVSCINDDIPEPADADREYGICLSLVTATPSGSRAAGITEETGSADENRIDIAGGDFRILLFAGYDDNARFIAAPDFNVEIKTEDYTEYMVWTKLPATFFESNGIDPDNLQDYQLMVLANWESLGASYRNMVPGETTVGDVKSYSGRFIRGFNPEGWRPFENGSKGIPMYGLLKFRKRKPDLGLNIGADGTFVPNVNTLYLLRALAKLEIIDRTAEVIDNPDKELNPWVESTSVSSYNSNGVAIPLQFVNGQQVNVPTIPADNGNRSIAYNLRKNDKVFSAYVTEQTLQNLYFNFKVKKKKRGWLGNIVEEERTIRKNVGDMISQTGYDKAFLRNHIYRIYVTLDINANISLKYVVCPWVEKTAGDITFD